MLGWAKVSLQLRLLELQREKTGKAILSVEPMGGQVWCPVLQRRSRPASRSLDGAVIISGALIGSRQLMIMLLSHCDFM